MSIMRSNIDALAACYKGGGGGGGGSGAVDYPVYMKAWHASMLAHMTYDFSTGLVDTIDQSINETMNTAFGNSPWTTAVAYNPDTPLADMIASATSFQTMVNLLSSGTGLDILVAGILDTSRVDDVVAEYSADAANRMNSEIIPRFEAGMRSINAVTSSAFAIGKAIIEEGQERNVAKFSADLHLKVSTDDALKVIMLKLQYQQAVTQAMVETNRIKIVAKKEETDSNYTFDERDAKWDLEVYQYGANLLAGIGAGTVDTGTNKPSAGQSAIGGAMSGAAAGAMVSGGNPVGIAAGAALGLASSFL